MLHFRSSSILKQYLSIQSRYKFTSSFNKLKILQIKNNSMLIVQDPLSSLAYMSEIITKQGNKGIVMKIQQGTKSIIGMYHQIDNIQQLNIQSIHKSWKQSLRSIIKENCVNNGIFDVNGNNITSQQNKNNTNNKQQSQQSQSIQLINFNKRRLLSTSAVLNTCYDMYYGDMINFIGCRGSKKSQNAYNIIKQFQNSNTQKQSICIYINPNYKQCVQLSTKSNQTLSFSVQKGKKPTDIGVYMLALKAINLSIQLKNKGKDLLLVIDNLNDIMMRQWTMLQSIKFNSKSIDSSKLFQYNTLKISPISLLNQIYANCQDNIKNNKNKKGSLTSILISQKQNNQLVQQISHFSNNLKHLQTLSKVIEFPIDFKINKNIYSKKQKQNEQNNQKITQINQNYTFMRNYVNEFLKQKSQTQLKRILYKNQLKDAPWDYFFLLDSQWWGKDFKQMTFQSFDQTNKFLNWIKYNIDNQLVGQWNIGAKASFNKLATYVKNQKGLAQQINLKQIEFTKEDYDEFIQQEKMEGNISPFKKDYLI